MASSMFSDACCSMPAITPTDAYKNKGKYTTLNNAKGDLPVYVTGVVSPKKRAIFAYFDIFGVHPNTEQVCDILSSQGYLVVMPDFFRGKPCEALKETPFNRDKVIGWMAENAPWTDIERDTNTVMDMLRQRGVAAVGAVGFCWGAKQVIQAKCFKSVAGVHPSGVDAETIAGVEVPVCMLPAKTDADMIPVFEVLKGRPFFDKCVTRRFDDMHHGWCAARADFSNELNVKRTTEACEILVEFFDSTLP